MFKLFVQLVLSSLALSSGSLLADTQSGALDIGIVPYMSARNLISSFEPMRHYLEKGLGKPVKIYTANGFKPFFQNAVKGDYDLVISAAHFARLLQKEHHYTPLVMFSPGNSALVMTGAHSPLKNVQDLRGQVIAVPEQLSLASIICMTLLRDNGLHPGIDYTLLEVPSFPSAILAVQKGNAAAAISASPVLASIPGDVRASVRTLLDAGDFNSFVFLAHPRMDSAESDLLKNILLKFGQSSNEGKLFLANTGFGNITLVTTQEMNKLDRYTTETKRLLNATP
jgi:phosphonate transport system substrate-binding protein